MQPLTNNESIIAFKNVFFIHYSAFYVPLVVVSVFNVLACINLQFKLCAGRAITGRVAVPCCQ